MKETELKPCPFCGGKVELMHIDHTNLNKRKFMFVCQRCSAHIFLYGYGVYVSKDRTEEQAIETWNRRADNEQRETDRS